jgi:hypothetical protein
MRRSYNCIFVRVILIRRYFLNRNFQISTLPRMSDGSDWAIALWLPAAAVARRALDADPIPRLESRLLAALPVNLEHTVTNKMGIRS